jgi:hypothetical protein
VLITEAGEVSSEDIDQGSRGALCGRYYVCN